MKPRVKITCKFIYKLQIEVVSGRTCGAESYETVQREKQQIVAPHCATICDKDILGIRLRYRCHFAF